MFRNKSIHRSSQSGKVLASPRQLTKRAPDAGDSAAISSSFLRLGLFLAGRLRRPRPSAGNACRWATKSKTKFVFDSQMWLMVELKKASSIFSGGISSSSRLFFWLRFLQRQKFRFIFIGFQNRLIFFRQQICSSLVLICKVVFF